MTTHRTIGLLGGSFNPAHDGHLHLSHEAMRWLGLDEVWWLLSPQNPLKSTDEMADYATRRAFTQNFLKGEKNIHLSEFENENNLQYTQETLSALAQTYPDTTFIWLMGADNLAGFHRWKGWETILNHHRIAIFDRAPYTDDALTSVAAQQFETYRLAENKATSLKNTIAPAWVYIKMPLHPDSSTEIRKTLGENAFLRHN